MMKLSKSYIKGEIVKAFSDLVYCLRDGRIPKPKEIDDLYKHLIRRLGLS
jgi:hypothetical protein